MERENLVLFKGHVGGITVIMDQQAPFEEILEQFKEKLQSSKKFFQGASINVHFKGRQLTEIEEDSLLQVLAKQNIVDISFVQTVGKELQRTSDHTRQDSISEQVKDGDRNHLSMTYFYHGIVRSGQHVEYNGSVVVLGDVNPGGMITAGGNIIILGNLSGKVHAGKTQRIAKPFVVAYNMQPSQITIGELSAQSPENEMDTKGKQMTPQIAYISNQQIYVEEIDYKTLNHMLE